jgi:hypothetical protein
MLRGARVIAEHRRDAWRSPRALARHPIRVYGLDAQKLRNVSQPINSLTFEQLATPLDAEPEDLASRLAAVCFGRDGRCS